MEARCIGLCFDFSGKHSKNGTLHFLVQYIKFILIQAFGFRLFRPLSNFFLYWNTPSSVSALSNFLMNLIRGTDLSLCWPQHTSTYNHPAERKVGLFSFPAQLALNLQYFFFHMKSFDTCIDVDELEQVKCHNMKVYWLFPPPSVYLHAISLKGC